MPPQGNIMTVAELATHSTVEAGLYMAAKGKVYDVTIAKEFYVRILSVALSLSYALPYNRHSVSNEIKLASLLLTRASSSFG